MQLGISDLEFDCSSGWLERFKVHHDISFKCVCGEANSIETNSIAMENWQTKLSKILQDYSPDQIYNANETGIFYRLFLRSYKISLDQIYNANETSIFYRLFPDKTLEFKNVSCHSGKLSKDRLTTMVCANMSGSDKLPILVIGKSKNPRCFKNVKSYQQNSWLTKRHG